MNNFTKGALLVVAIVWILPGVLTMDYLNSGPMIALRYGGWLPFFIVFLSLPLLGGVIYDKFYSKRTSND